MDFEDFWKEKYVYKSNSGQKLREERRRQKTNRLKINLV